MLIRVKGYGGSVLAKGNVVGSERKKMQKKEKSKSVITKNYIIV